MRLFTFMFMFMSVFTKLISLCRRQFRGPLSLLPLVSVTVLLVALLAGPADIVTSKVLFQSPADTPTPAPTHTPVPVPTNTPVPAPTDTPQPSPTPMLATDTPPAATPSPAALPPTDTPPATMPSPTTSPPDDTPTIVLPTHGAIQMPLLPPTATPESLLPAPTPTATSKSLLSPRAVGWIVVVASLVLAAVVGLVLGYRLRNSAPQS
jgi:hypothetical protein